MGEVQQIDPFYALVFKNKKDFDIALEKLNMLHSDQKKLPAGFCEVCGVKLDNPTFTLCKTHWLERHKDGGKQ